MATNSAEKVTQNSRVDDPITAAMNAIVGGQDAAEAVYGPGASGFSDSPLSEAESNESPNLLDNIQEDEENQSEAESDTEASQETKEAEQAPSIDRVKETSSKATSNTKNIEEVFVKSLDGKRKALTIDYTNKDAIKQAYLKAEGMQLFRQQRDNSRKELETLKREHNDIKESWTKLETIWNEQGAKGVLRQLGGDKAIQELVDAELRHKEYLSSLSPEEKYRLELKTQREAATKQASETELSYKKKLEALEAKEEQASTRSLESRLHPAFDRYRFAGKLGDDVVEQQLDESVWTTTMKRLEQYPDDIELTQSIVDREFRTVAQNLQKVINVQAEKRVAKTVDRKKADATKVAQITAKKGLSNSGEKEKFVDSIKSGNILDAIGSMMSGKIKL